MPTPKRHYLARHEMNVTPAVKTGEWLDPRGNPVIEVRIIGLGVALLSPATAEGLIKRLQREVDKHKDA
jgi:hypothetical protein